MGHEQLPRVTVATEAKLFVTGRRTHTCFLEPPRSCCAEANGGEPGGARSPAGAHQAPPRGRTCPGDRRWRPPSWARSTPRATRDGNGKRCCRVASRRRRPVAGGAGGVSHGKGQRTAPAAPRPPRRPYGEREAQGEAEALWEPEEGTLPLSGAVGTGAPAVTWGVEVCLRNEWVRHPAPRGEIGGRGVSPLAPIWWPRQGWGPLALIKGGGLASPLRPIVLRPIVRPARGLDVGQLLAALPWEATGPGVKEGVGRDGTGCGVWSGRRGGPPGTRRAACGSGLWSSVGFAAACGAARSRDPETGGGGPTWARRTGSQPASAERAPVPRPRPGAGSPTHSVPRDTGQPVTGSPWFAGRIWVSNSPKSLDASAPALPS